MHRTRLGMTRHSMCEADADTTERPAKRQRVHTVLQHKYASEEIDYILYVRWHGQQGQTKLNKLPLRGWEQFDALEELPKELIESRYPTSSQFPAYFTSPSYVRFTPQVECLALPGDIVRTELRLTISFKGWEYTVLKQDMHQPAGQDQDMHVMVAEFMGSDPLMAALGLRMSLIAYPVVALRKVFLEDLQERLLTAPEQFKGIL